MIQRTNFDTKIDLQAILYKKKAHVIQFMKNCNRSSTVLWDNRRYIGLSEFFQRITNTILSVKTYKTSYILSASGIDILLGLE